MSKKISTRIVHKHDIEVNWLKATSFVPMQGELIIYDIDDNYKYERFKIGDGSTTVSALPFCVSQPDFNQTDSTAIDFIKNKTHWVEPKLNVIISETTETDSIPLPDNSLFSAENYIVTVDGAQYLCTIYPNADGEISLGDSRLYVVGGEIDMSHPMDVPFFAVSYWDFNPSMGETACVQVVYPDSNPHTISIAEVTDESIYHPLDENFIPDTIMRTADLDLTVDEIKNYAITAAAEAATVATATANRYTDYQLTNLKSNFVEVTNEEINALFTPQEETN